MAFNTTSSVTEQPAYYAGQPIDQPSQGKTRAQRLEILLWHPLFTGKCPQCSQALPSDDLTPSRWQCEQCGWEEG
jgi:hypothetical protein